MTTGFRVYIQLFNDLGEMIDEIEVQSDESNLHALANSGWVINAGDTIKVVKEYNE